VAGCLGWLALALLASGCGPRYGNISGKVTYKGAPVAGGTITFYDSVNQNRSTDIKPDGTYTIPRVASGQARVTVAAPMDIKFGGKAISGDANVKPMNLPAKYSDPEKSGLTYDVTAGENQKNFELGD
jgi:hypothetical protein